MLHITFSLQNTQSIILIDMFGFLVSDMNIIGNIIYPHLLFQVFHQKQSNISELQKCEVTALSKTSGALTG